MTNLQFNTALAILIVAVSALTYMATKAFEPAPAPDLVRAMMSLSPEELASFDRELTAVQAELEAASEELRALSACSRAATTVEAWGNCAR